MAGTLLERPRCGAGHWAAAHRQGEEVCASHSRCLLSFAFKGAFNLGKTSISVLLDCGESALVSGESALVDGCQAAVRPLVACPQALSLTVSCLPPSG